MSKLPSDWFEIHAAILAAAAIAESDLTGSPLVSHAVDTHRLILRNKINSRGKKEGTH